MPKSKQTIMIERVVIVALSITLFVLCLFVVLGRLGGTNQPASTVSSPVPVATPESD